MAWSWRYEAEDAGTDAGGIESFTSQSDAESWQGQPRRELVANGVVTAGLVEDDRVEYRMSLLQASP